MNSDFLIVRRVIQVGAINTIVGPLILILFQYFLNDLVLSFFLNSIFMIFFKFYMYKKIAFRDIKSKRAYLLPITLILWGLFLANLIQNTKLLEIYKIFLLLISVTISNSFIAVLGARIINRRDRF